jgi:tetratricopeptide (TPR) repeat protein
MIVSRPSICSSSASAKRRGSKDSLRPANVLLKKSLSATEDETMETSLSFFFSDGDSSITTENNDDSNQASIISAIPFDLEMGTSQRGCNDFSAGFNTVDTIAKSCLPQVATNGEGASRQTDRKQSFEMYLQRSGNHGKPSFKALKLLLSTLELRCHCHGESHPSVTRAWNDIGDFFLSTSETTCALEAFHRAVNCSSSSKEVAEAYSNIGMVHFCLNDTEKSIIFLEKALDYLKSIEKDLEVVDPQKSLERAMIFHRLGLAHTRKASYSEAMDYLAQALETRTDVYGPEHGLVGATTDAMGRLHFLQGNTEAAMACHVQALNIFFAMKECDLSAVSCLANIANICLQKQDYERAMKAQTKIIQVHSAYLARYQADPEKQHLVSREVCGIIDTVKSMAVSQGSVGYSREASRCIQEASLLYDSQAHQEDSGLHWPMLPFGKRQTKF